MPCQLSLLGACGELLASLVFGAGQPGNLQQPAFPLLSQAPAPACRGSFSWLAQEAAFSILEAA